MKYIYTNILIKNNKYMNISYDKLKQKPQTQLADILLVNKP